MRARARIVTAAVDGATVLRELRGEPPLLPRVTGTRGPTAVAEVHLVGGAAGPIGGDELCLDIDVGPGASLVLRTVAATVALPGPHGQPSSTTIRAGVAAGLAIGGRAPHSAGPAVLDGNLAYGTVLIIDGQARPPATVDGGCLMALAEPGASVATAVAPTAHHLRRTLERLAGIGEATG